jgi:acetolactate synthase-1/2/3 large subunit
MVNGVAHAFMDRAPLIAITDQYSAPTFETGLRQRLDQLALYAPVVKWNATVNARSVAQQLRRAMRTATAPPPGPVHFDLPQSETTREAAILTVPPPLLPEVVQPGPDRAALRRPLEMLRAGCIIGGLIERKLVSQADLIVTVGLDAIELQPKPWPYSQPVLALSPVPSLDALVPSAPEVIGDLRVLLARLAEWLGNGSDWGEAAARIFRDEVTAALDTPARGLSPQRAMEVARAVLPRETVATCDAGASRLLVVQKWQAYRPREFLTSNGLGSMGYALPGALAARLAHPAARGGVQRRRWFPDGDAELQTSVHEKLPIIVVVLDDSEIGLIRVKQAIKQIPPYGVQLGGVDRAKVAQGFGADGTVVETEQGLADALTAAVASGRTTVIGVRIDPSGYVAQFNALCEL